MLCAGCAEEYEAARESDAPDAQVDVDAIRELTGGPTRVVWLQDTADGSDYLAWGRSLRMVGLDTEDGGVPRVLLPAGQNMVKPMFTAGGEWVIFSDRDQQQIFALNWQDRQVVDLGPGFGLATWLDPQSGVEWLYLARDRIQDDRILPAYASLHRYPLFADPRAALPRTQDDLRSGELELVWDQTQVSEDSFQLSADGRYASTAFPWPQVGILDFEQNRWIRLGQGCWVAMSPDNDYLFWVFDGPHRNVRVFRAEIDENWLVNINSAPGMDGFEVYHPRWSNHPRIIAVSGPYKVGDGAYRLPGGGTAVSIHLGRFNARRTTVPDWVRVSDDSHADFYPDVWVRPDPEAIPPSGQDMTQPERSTAQDLAWPHNTTDLLYIWENAAGRHDIMDPQSGAQRIFRPQPRLHARYGRHHVMRLHQGFFIDSAAAEHFQDLGPITDFTLEFLATPEPADAPEPNQGGGNEWVFALTDASAGQEAPAQLAVLAGQDHWRIRTPEDEIAFFLPHPDQPAHIVLSVRQDEAEVFVNGRRTTAGRLRLGPEAWDSATTLLFGGDAHGGHDWPGRLEHIALYARPMGQQEVAANAGHVLARLARRPAPESVTIRAEVTQASAVPAPEDIAPYRRGLVVNEYQVLEVLQGELNADRLLAAHWAILDGAVLETASRPEGSEHVLRLEPFADRTELEGERLSQDTDDFLLELYFDRNL